MNNPFFLAIGLVIMNHISGQICLFRIKRVLPNFFRQL
jgi:hypothetical protein